MRSHLLVPVFFSVLFVHSSSQPATVSTFHKRLFCILSVGICAFESLTVVYTFHAWNYSQMMRLFENKKFLDFN